VARVAAELREVTTGQDHQLLNELAAAVAAGKPVVLATVVAAKRSVPRHAGTKMLVYRDGGTTGTVGGGAMESRVIEEAHEALRTGMPKLLEYELLEPARGDPGVCGGEVQIYLEPYMPPHTVFVVGAGHVGRAVVDLAHWLGYRTVVTDDRGERLTVEAMPNADLPIAAPVPEAAAKYDITEDTSVIVVSRDTEIDVAAVTHLIDTPARYIGVMGSKRRWNAVRRRLVETGIDESKLDRIHAPIGIELGAETVEEIAVSILSEVIRVTREADSAAGT
jgi:xanthine dehydrogenase accessory factor